MKALIAVLLLLVVAPVTATAMNLETNKSFGVGEQRILYPLAPEYKGITLTVCEPSTGCSSSNTTMEEFNTLVDDDFSKRAGCFNNYRSNSVECEIFYSTDRVPVSTAGDSPELWKDSPAVMGPNAVAVEPTQKKATKKKFWKRFWNK